MAFKKFLKDRKRTNYKELDQPVRDLARDLNRFDGIQTIGSCGGHKNPRMGQFPKNEWYVSFEVEHTESGWFALEFLSWFSNNYLVRSGLQIRFYPFSEPPYLNYPGRTLRFLLEGRNIRPSVIVEKLRDARKDGGFVKPSQMEKCLLYSWGKDEVDEYHKRKRLMDLSAKVNR